MLFVRFLLDVLAIVRFAVLFVVVHIVFCCSFMSSQLPDSLLLDLTFSLNLLPGLKGNEHSVKMIVLKPIV